MKIVLPEERPRVEVPVEGNVVMLSPILKSDRKFFEEGIDLLSVESKYMRFGQGISHLSERELDYLTDLDQRQHVAWGAAVVDEIAGVSRFIRPQEGCPEVAVTVLDEYQRHGIGPILFSALAAVARHDGIEELCFEASEDNAAVRKILKSYELSPIAHGGSLYRQIRLSDVPETPYDASYVEVIEEIRSTR